MTMFFARDGAVADLDRVGAREARAALQPFDLVLLEQELDAAGQALDRVRALAVHRLEVELTSSVPTPILAIAPLARFIE